MLNFNKLNWISPKITTGFDELCGRSQIACDNIKKDELLVVFGGHVLTLEEFQTLPVELHDFGYQIGENPDLVYCLTNLDELGEGDFFNHSCNPNSGFKSPIHLVAMRDIQNGEQITFDYAICVTATFGDMDCFCQSIECRGFVSGEDWKIKHLQEKYQGYFQPYIAEKIKQLNEDNHSMDYGI